MRGPLLVLLGPTPWEGPFVAALAHPASGVTIARRCLDTADLLASASAGLGAAAVVGADAPRLDADVLARLGTLGVPVVGLVTAGDSDAVRRLTHWGAHVAGQDAAPVDHEGLQLGHAPTLATRAPPASADGCERLRLPETEVAEQLDRDPAQGVPGG